MLDTTQLNRQWMTIIASNGKEVILFLQAHSVVDILQKYKLNTMSGNMLNQVSMEARKSLHPSIQLQIISVIYVLEN